MCVVYYLPEHRPPCGNSITRKQGTAFICIQCMTKGEEEAYKHTHTLQASPAAARTQRAPITWRSSFTTALTPSFKHLTALQVGS